jgi:thiamine-phosphate pyrophosphorylase
VGQAPWQGPGTVFDRLEEAVEFRLPRIYPITDKGLSRKPSHFAIIRELIRGGATLLQVRDKLTPVRELLPDLRRCVEYARERGVVVIVNDRCDLVLCSGADGVHLGQNDIPPLAARKVLGARHVIGFSTHSLAQVRQGGSLGVQYLGFGPVYGTSTKPGADPVTGISALRRACRLSRRPVVAIGGITLDTVPEVLGAGASSAAVISALMTAKSLAHQMEAFRRAAREIE